jgi:hypothetical protein
MLEGMRQLHVRRIPRRDVTGQETLYCGPTALWVDNVLIAAAASEFNS